MASPYLLNKLMDKQEIKPFDDTEIDMALELMVRSKFKKEKGGMVNITTDLMTLNGKKIDPSVMG